MKRIFFGIFPLGLLFLVFSCSKKTESCVYQFQNIIAPDSEVVKVQTYLAMNAISATKDTSGLFYAIDQQGSGAVAGLCSKITVKYTGSFTDGTVFDSTGNSSASWTLGQLITGWQIGVPMINAGGRIRLYIPPSLAYGAAGVKDNSGNVIIPGNAILIFDINLTAVN